MMQGMLGEPRTERAQTRHILPIVGTFVGLESAPERGSRFTAVPVTVKGFGTFPVRAFVSIED